MATFRSSRILPTILTIVVIIIAIAGFVALMRLIFGGGTTEPVIDTSRQNLLSTSEGRAVSMTVRGPIVADEDFRSYQVVISPTERRFTSYTGYLEVITNSQTLSNNTAAYDQFVNALNKANMVEGTPFEGERNNVLGICASGRVYEFRTINNNETTEMLWTSTCSGSPGSLRASATQLSQLFRSQIPEDAENIDDMLQV